MKKGVSLVLALVGVNLIYACVSIFTKLASGQEWMSGGYMLCIAGAFGIMGIYAVLWQQILTRAPLSTAYMFKGTSLIFVLLISFFLFGEKMTWNNLLGAVLIVTGIVLYSKT